jgi:tetratricopeptide (TPR) repeat protein/predicted regulator of Ras-like GTPase activity (Roadblock/LC7/MglB family)
MRTPAQADLKRWSDDVARDPRSLAFLPLARAYRRRGLGEEAMKLCLRGLEAYPSHVEAHGLLALLYLDQGDHQKAADEWSIVLRMDPDNFDALRGLGFCFLEQDQLSRARQMLQRAATLRSSDPTVQEALRLLGTRQELAERGIGSKPALTHEQLEWAHELPAAVRFTFAAPDDSPPASTGAAAGRSEQAAAAQKPEQPAPPEAAAASLTDAATGAEAPTGATADPAAGAVSAAGSAAPAGAAGYVDAEPIEADPERLFDGLLATGPLLGALFVDAQGLVVAGRITREATSDAALLGAVFGGVTDEALRTASHLSLGGWTGIHMEAAGALMQLVPADSGGVVVLAARRSTPAGWLRRAAVHAAGRARRYLEAYG